MANEHCWPATGQVDPFAFSATLRHARMVTVETYRACDFELAKPCCPSEPYLMTNFVVAVLAGAGYKDLLETQGPDAARFWLEHALQIISSELTMTTGQRVKINIEVRDDPSGG